MQHLPKQFKTRLDRFLETITISSEIPFGLLMINVMSKKKKEKKYSWQVLFYNNMIMYIKVNLFFS